MQYILTEAEYNELLHYKNEYQRPASIGQKHIELLVKYNELESKHLALKADYDNVLLNSIKSIDKKSNHAYLSKPTSKWEDTRYDH